MRILSCLLASLLTLSLQAQQLQLSHLFTDHAVLQRETSVPVWGWGQPGAKVEVTGSWNGAKAVTKVADDGSWRVALPTAQAGGPYTLSVKSGKEALTVNDIALGEVWICSGQSNMEMPMQGFGFQEIEGATEAILAAPETAAQVRVFDIKTPKKTSPEKDVYAHWAYTDGAVTAQTSAVGYFFARRLTRSLGVPVGIIVNAWGGSRIEPWMTNEMIDASGITAEDRKAIDPAKLDRIIGEYKVGSVLNVMHDAAHSCEQTAAMVNSASVNSIPTHANAFLPLKENARILVTGPNANSLRTLNGGWSYRWQGDADAFVPQYNTIVEALQHRFKHVSYEPGVKYLEGADDRWRLGKGDFRLSCGGLSALLTCTQTKVWNTPNI